MNSMKRTSTPLSRPNSARSRISSSLTPRSITALILTLENPAWRAASIPANTRANSSRRVIVSNFFRSRVSKLILMRAIPARRNSSTQFTKVAPLVVIARSMGWPANGEAESAGTTRAANLLTKTGKWARIVGSPPVRRIPSTP